MKTITGNKEEVIGRLCMLCTEVQHFVYKYDVPAACFCEKSEVDPDEYQFDTRILKYIEDAVHAKLLIDKMVK